MSLGALELDLDVFSGPFDLLLTLVLREEVDLLELSLAEVVLAYIDHLERPPQDAHEDAHEDAHDAQGHLHEAYEDARDVHGAERDAHEDGHERGAHREREQLDLEVATEFIVLVAALLELKSRLLLSGEEEELLDIEPQEAAEELLARMLDARRFRTAASHLRELLAAEEGVRFRAAPAPASLRRAIVHETAGQHDPGLLGQAIGRLLALPPSISVRHIATHRVTVAERLAHLRRLLRAGAFTFEEAVRGADRMTVAVTLFALLELYKEGEVEWRQQESFGEISVRGRGELRRPDEQGPRALALGAGAPASMAG